MPYCPFCDASIPGGLRRCPECDEPLRSRRQGTSRSTPPAARGDARRRRPPQKSTAPLLIGVGVFGGIALLVGVAILIKSQTKGGLGFSSDNRPLSKNHLKQLGIAIHNYHDVYSQFPPGGIYDLDERAYHGWQTSILPMMDQMPLYHQIDFHVPWDDPKNVPIFQYEIEQYYRGSDEQRKDDAGLGLSHWAANQQTMFANSSLRFREMIDGPSNTILAGEVVGEFKPWGHPANWRDPAKGINKGPASFGNPFRESGLFLMGDGTVREISESVDPETLRRLSDPADREPIGEF